MLFNTLLAGVGGLIGSMLRYLMVTWVFNLLEYPDFPYGTLIVNLTGCFIIGFLNSLAETREIFTPEIRIFIFIGILGGYTTFSSFGYETFSLLRDGAFLSAALNAAVQLFMGLAAVWVGFSISKLIWG